EDPFDEGAPVLVQPRRERKCFPYKTLRVSFWMAPEIGAVEGVFTDVCINLDAALVGIADQLRKELPLDIPVCVMEGGFLAALHVVVEGIEVEGVRLVTRQREGPFAVHADGPSIELVEQRPVDHPFPFMKTPVAVVISLDAGRPSGIPGQLR